MQLMAWAFGRRREGLLGWLLACAALLLARPEPLAADSRVDATSTVFNEWGGPLHMTVINPGVKADVELAELLALQASWEADVVSGASVAIVDAPGASELDAVTSATKVEDVRHVVRGGASLRSDNARLTAGYGYGFERDYRSHALTVSGVSEPFDRNSTLELTFARGWDAVCDLHQPGAQEAVERQRLPSSDGCFGKGRQRTEQSLDLHAVSGSWTQAWTPIFNTQWGVSAQLASGFQSNPYRAVWLGRAAAQEHHPSERARYATTLAARLWLPGVGGALQLSGRLYRDSWDVQSASGELGYERSLFAGLRLRARGRYYRQGGAAFYSDDYALAPRGAYFTGDRELSPMSSWLLGAWLEWRPEAIGPGGSVAWLSGLRLLLKGDYLQHAFERFHYGSAEVPNRRSIFATVSVETTF